MMRVGRFIFKIRLIPTLAALLLFSLFMALGCWQLQRYQEKQDLSALYKAQSKKEIIQLDGSQQAVDELRYRLVVVSGEYDSEHQFLVDNRVYKSKPGYFVLTPLRLKQSKWAILVNRGWVSLGKDRSVLPELSITQKVVRITGIVNSFPSPGLKLKGAEIPTPGWPGLVQLVDAQTLSKVLGYPLVPYQLMLSDKHSDGYVREWKVVQYLTPDRHLAYAFQWFSLAFLIVIYFLWGSFKIHE